MKTSQQSVLKSFANAFAGISYFFANDRNGKIHLSIAIAVIITSITLHIAALEWLAILLCIGIVIGLEMMNTALEKLCDLVEPNYHPTIKVIKDVSAAAVVLSAIISIIIGAIIFLPKIMLFL